MNMQDLQRECVRVLAAAGVEQPALDARLLLAHALGCTREELLLHPQRALTEGEMEAVRGLVARRARREPVSHILGRREFYGRKFMVNPHVLDPRADSETLIDAVLDAWPEGEGRSALDLGTGSGCLLLTLLAERPKSVGVGVDASADALSVARANASALGLSARAHFIRGDWAEGIMGRFDVIVSNPPYIPERDRATLAPEVVEYEPHLALFGGKDGLDCYRKIANHLIHALVPEGLAALEIGIGQREDAANIVEAAGLRVKAIRNDLAGIARCLIVTH